MPSLQQYRQALARSRDMGGYIPFTATSASVASTAAREIICSTLISSSLNVVTRYAGAWVYGVTDGDPDTLAGVQRRVTDRGFDATTGMLTVSAAFGSTPASGAAWELYWRIPAIADLGNGRDGYREIINEALRLMVMPDTITVAGVSNQTKYTLDLTTYPWLRESGRIVNVKRPTPNATDLERVDAQGWTLIPDGEALILQLPSAYSTGDTFKLDVKRPANSRLKQSGTWTDQASLTAGLSLDADEAIPSINDVVAVARELCFWELDGHEPNMGWAEKAEKAAFAAATLKFVRQAPTEPYRPLRLSGVGDMSIWR